MSWLRFFRREERDAESVRDLQFYLDTETEDNIARGMSPEEARASAWRKLGNTSAIREEIYLMSTFAFVETIWKDLLYALRTMRKNPAFAATAILTLALGIGGNTVLFTVIRAVLLKPLEYGDPDRLVYLTLDNPKLNLKGKSFSLLRLDETRATVQSFSGVGAFLKNPESVTISGGGDPESLQQARVSANFLEVLGVQPLRGRGFLAEEDTPGGAPAAMISADFWRRRFGGDPQVVGTPVTLDSTPHTVIGVLPSGFAFPFAGVDVWVTKPSHWSGLPARFWSGSTPLNLYARLKPHVSLEQARAEMDVLQRQYARAHPERVDSKPGVSVLVTWLKEQVVANVGPMLWMLFGAVGFVLLIACANVASLLLARGSSRSREFALRSALGAARGRLIGQLLAESLALAAAGGILGVLLASWSLRAIPHIDALHLPRSGEIHLDLVVLGFTVALSIATGVLFGLFPSLQVSRPDLVDVLRESGTGAGRESSGRRGRLGFSLRSLLVVGQVALSLVLLIGAGLLMKSFVRLNSVDPGFHPTNVLTMKIALSPSRYDTDRKKAAFFGELARRAEAVPGVRSATIALSLPTTTSLNTNVGVEGQPPVEPVDQPIAQLQSITPGYFRTLGISLLRGREFHEADNSPGAPPVMIVNESFARRFWPNFPDGRNPVGQHVGEGLDKLKSAEIVGIVADVREAGLASAAGLEFYVPCVLHAPQVAYLAIRSEGDPLRFAGAIRSQVLAIDRDQSVADIKSMQDVLETTVGQRRLTMLLLAAFAGVAVLLALIGIYSVIAYQVAQRTHEVGIRRALGAESGDILRLVLGQGLMLALIGVAVGVLGAFALGRLVEGLLFQVKASDPGTFGVIAVLFLAVALLASLIPAQRAARIDPMSALRQ